MKVGIVGCGLMGTRRATHLEPDDELVACFDPAPIWPHATEEMKRKRYESIYDVYEKSEAIVIATTHDTLAPLAIKALMNNVSAILLEKPCATSASDANKILEIASKNGAIVVPGFTLRHYPGIQLARNATHAKMPICIRALYGHPGREGYEKEWRCEASKGGGELLDQGVHLIDLAQFLLGQVEIQDYALHKGRWGDVDDNAFLRLKTADTNIIIQASWTEFKPVFRLEIVFDDSLIIVYGLDGGYGTHEFEHSHKNSVSYVDWSGSRDIALKNEWSYFKRCIKDRSNIMQDAVHVLEIVDAAKQLTEWGK